ncbi:MAG: VOC family protein [Leptolyngbyaceae cyanobacterium]
MTEFTSYAPSTFCWVDLATTDAEAAKAFYTKLFNWTATDVPAGEAGTYTMLEKSGKNVCALYQMPPEMKPEETPPYWLSYVSVNDIADSTHKAQALGGQILQPPCEVMDSGHMSLIQDPTGAIFALWQPQQHHGADLANEPGAFCWNELQTKDLTKATNFYTQLLGWKTQLTKNAQGGDYIEFQMDDKSSAGMLEIQSDWGDVPPNWVVYFAVENCDATVEKAQALGGQIEMPPMDIANVGRFAILQDPQGAYFTVIQIAS